MGEIWFSEIEHPCTLGAAARWFEGRICSLPATRRGVLDLDHLRERLKTARPGLVAVMAANNETGILQPWREAGDLCREQGVPFLCDAAQWMGRLPAAGLGECTAVAGCAHKFGGPLGVGFLKGPERMSPLLVGGPQEDARRAGTENLPGILGMLAALEECEGKLAIAVPVSPRDTFIRALLEALPGTEIVGAGGDRLWNTVTAILPAPIDCRQRWVVKLDRAGCAASTGSACASGKEQTSHVLAAQGISPEQAGRTIRFSAGWSTTEGDWADLLAIIQKAALSMRTMDGEG